LKNLTETFEEEKSRKDEVLKQQAAELE